MDDAYKQNTLYMRSFLVVLLSLVSVFFLTSCSNTATDKDISAEQESIDAFYEEFLTAWSGTSFDSIAPYLHFEEDMFRQEMTENFRPIFDYKIESRKRLAENFWVFHVYLTNANSSYISEAYHFIGEIDGQLQVMIGRYAVPASLRRKTKIDILQFKPENALDKEDTIIIQ